MKRKVVSAISLALLALSACAVFFSGQVLQVI